MTVSPQPFGSQPSASCPPSQSVHVAGRVTKIAIDKRAREGGHKGHEESLAGVLPASGRLRGEEASGCGDPTSSTEPGATTHCRTHRTLCSSQEGKCQHGDLQLSARDHRDRFKNGAHHASLQENERGKMRSVLASGGQNPFIIGRGLQNGSECNRLWVLKSRCN
jgi:hypothetical protein